MIRNFLRGKMVYTSVGINIEQFGKPAQDASEK